MRKHRGPTGRGKVLWRLFFCGELSKGVMARRTVQGCDCDAIGRGGLDQCPCDPPALGVRSASCLPEISRQPTSFLGSDAHHACYCAAACHADATSAYRIPDACQCAPSPTAPST